MAPNPWPKVRRTRRDLLTWWPILTRPYFICHGFFKIIAALRLRPLNAFHHLASAPEKGQTKNALSLHVAPSSQSVSCCCRRSWRYYCSTILLLLSAPKKRAENISCLSIVQLNEQKKEERKGFSGGVANKKFKMVYLCKLSMVFALQKWFPAAF